MSRNQCLRKIVISPSFDLIRTHASNYRYYFRYIQLLKCEMGNSPRKSVHPTWKSSIENYHVELPKIDTLGELPYLLTYKELELYSWTIDSTLGTLQFLKCIPLINYKKLVTQSVTCTQKLENTILAEHSFSGKIKIENM